jgi:citrate synthase
MSSNTLTITDNRTNRTYTLPIENETVCAADFQKIRTGEDSSGLMVYDPGFVNTASCKSSITFVDGKRGILEFRGYPIEVLAEHCTFLEVAYLLLFGELPDEAELKQWAYEITHHSMLNESTIKFMEGFRYDAHPMSMLVSTVATLSAVYPDAKNVQDPANRLLQIKRLIAKMPTITAWSYRHSVGFPYVYPDNDLSYTENFMNMLWRMVEPKYAANPVLARALDELFILHADHEQNCSTNAMRGVGSSFADPYFAISAAAGALSGPLHGGANEQVLKMLNIIGSTDNVPGYLEKVKQGKARLPGFGHRLYGNGDPRAGMVKRIADQVFEITGRNPRFDIALELERAALQDKYFVERSLYPNVDYYSGIIYQAMGFQPEIFTVLFAIPRCVGWLAQWDEMHRNAEQKIARPRQIYTGHRKRSFIPLKERAASGAMKG